jgi:hypothetical protein
MSNRYAAKKKACPVHYRSMLKLALVSVGLLTLMAPIVTQRVGAQKAKPEKRSGSISGRVTTQGKPVVGLELALMPGPDFSVDQAVASVTTDEDGEYSFADVPPNHYWVDVKSRQYVSLDESRRLAGRSVSVAAGAIVTGANLDLIVGGAISGRIIDIEGNAVVGEPVSLYVVTNYGPRSHPLPLDEDDFRTNSKGDYRINGIRPGLYVVGVGVDIARLTGAVMDKNDFFWAQGRVAASRYFGQTFSPGTSEPEQAHPIEVAPSSEVQGIDITVGRPQPTFTARGRVINAQTGKILPGQRRLHVAHRIGGGGGHLSTMVNDQVNDDGTFEITGLLSERFFASVDFPGDTDLCSDKVEFQIKDADISDLEIKAYRGFSVSGIVDLERDAPPDAVAKRRQLTLVAASPVTSEASAFMHHEVPVNTDGTFKMLGLPPGPVEISTGDCDVCHYFELARIEYPTAATKGRTRLAESSHSPDTRVITMDQDLRGVHVVLHFKGASIACHVDVTGTPPPSVRLMILLDYKPADKKAGWGGWRDVDSDGDLLEEGLEPGDYDITVGDGSRRFSDPKHVSVTKNKQTKVSFTIDASRIQRRD